jgi:hypothetical protein
MTITSRSTKGTLGLAAVTFEMTNQVLPFHDAGRASGSRITSSPRCKKGDLEMDWRWGDILSFESCTWEREKSCERAYR